MQLIYSQNVIPNLNIANINQPINDQTLNIIPSQQLNENPYHIVNNMQLYSPNYQQQQQQLVNNSSNEYINFTKNSVMPPIQQPIQYYIAQYPENLYNYSISSSEQYQQQQQLADHFQRAMQISLNTNMNNNSVNNAALLNNAITPIQLIPINTQNEIFFMTVPGSLFDFRTAIKVPYVINPTQQVMIPYNLQTPIYIPNVENVEKVQLSTNEVNLSSSLETEHTLKNTNS